VSEWLGRVLTIPGAADQGAFDVPYASDSGAKADIAGLPRWVEIIFGLYRLSLSEPFAAAPPLQRPSP
jgi:hypothetical protein